ncbi:lysyl-tRNA synthetase [Streptococcus pneumoniae DAR831]|nr:lysyl-tRNA synthetase [Streptococcus pneumoniae DAR831]
MKIKEQTSPQAAQNTVLRLWIELTKSVTYIRQGEADVV